MAVSTIPEPIVKNKKIGILTFNNASSLRIPVGRVTGVADYINIVVSNANQGILSMISRGATTIIHNIGNTPVTVSSDGTDAIISKSECVFWGSTLVIVSANFDLSCGG